MQTSYNIADLGEVRGEGIHMHTKGTSIVPLAEHFFPYFDMPGITAKEASRIFLLKPQGFQDGYVFISQGQPYKNPHNEYLLLGRKTLDERLEKIDSKDADLVAELLAAHIIKSKKQNSIDQIELMTHIKVNQNAINFGFRQEYHGWNDSTTAYELHNHYPLSLIHPMTTINDQEYDFPGKIILHNNPANENEMLAVLHYQPHSLVDMRMEILGVLADVDTKNHQDIILTLTPSGHYDLDKVLENPDIFFGTDESRHEHRVNEANKLIPHFDEVRKNGIKNSDITVSRVEY